MPDPNPSLPVTTRLPRLAESSPVRALLWDADGVLQHAPHGWDWQEELDRLAAPGFSEAVWAAELPALRGERPLVDCLTEVLREWPSVDLDVDYLVGLWERTERDPEAFAVLHEVRSLGIACHLATNQQDHRRAMMRDAWGYDEHFDEVFYSCDLGAMKPDPAYFVTILDTLGLPPQEVGFIDDSEANVVAAQRLGITAVHHDPTSGAAVLRRTIEGLLGMRLG